MFEQAARLKVRFDSPKGLLSVEELWELPLTVRNGGASLDNIAKGLNRQIKETDTESFVVKAPKADAVLKLKFEIVIHIISVRMAEAAVAEAAAEKAKQKDKILAVIARKQDEKLEGASLEDLQKMVSEL